jgi:hypothetical protein
MPQVVAVAATTTIRRSVRFGRYSRTGWLRSLDLNLQQHRRDIMSLNPTARGLKVPQRQSNICSAKRAGKVDLTMSLVCGFRRAGS